MSATLLTTFAGARLLTFIAPKFAYDGSAPPWFAVHVGKYVIPPHKPTPAEPTPETVTHDEARIEHCSVKEALKDPHISANPHKFDPAAYTMGPDKFAPRPRVGMPNAPQPPPAPLPNAHLYEEFRVPRILRRMTAKTLKGQRRFHEWRESAFRQRKMLYDTGEQLLHEAEFKGDHADRRAHCFQCGASFFERKMGRLRCRDCRWQFDDSTYMEPRDHGVPFGFSLSDLTSDRETNGLRQNDQQARKDWFPLWQARFNPAGNEWKNVTTAEVEAVKSDPDFATEVARYQVMFTGSRTSEIAEGLPNTLTKRFARSRELPTWAKAFFQDAYKKNKAGEFAVVIHLNNRAEVKPLGNVSDSDAKLHRALLKHYKATEKGALKSLRREAPSNGWTGDVLAAKTQQAKERIAAAYRLPLEALGQQEGTDVTFSQVGEKETDTEKSRLGNA